jgi:hypothetical protein
MSEIYWSMAAVLAGKVTHVEVWCARSQESVVINYFYAKAETGGEGAAWAGAKQLLIQLAIFVYSYDQFPPTSCMFME